jgi:hypothetical protein
VRADKPGHISQLMGFGASPKSLIAVVPSVIQSGFSNDAVIQPGSIGLLRSHCGQLCSRHDRFALVSFASLACSLPFAHEAETNVFDKKPETASRCGGRYFAKEAGVCQL